ncbi:hypothetical protein Q0601_06575 [Paracoccus onubensis]|nr:hypothetical protein [Paracoccus onubensis]
MVVAERLGRNLFPAPASNCLAAPDHSSGPARGYILNYWKRGVAEGSFRNSE